MCVKNKNDVTSGVYLNVSWLPGTCENNYQNTVRANITQ